MRSCADSYQYPFNQCVKIVIFLRGQLQYAFWAMLFDVSVTLFSWHAWLHVLFLSIKRLLWPQDSINVRWRWTSKELSSASTASSSTIHCISIYADSPNYLDGVRVARVSILQVRLSFTELKGCRYLTRCHLFLKAPAHLDVESTKWSH